MKKIVYTRLDGGVSIVNPTPQFLASFADEADGMATIRARNVPPDATDVVQVDETNIPADRTYRNAWRQNGGAFSTDMPMAREIHSVHIGIVKRKKARELIEREMMGEDVTAERAALRAVNATAQIAAAQTPAALKAVWPVILG